MLNNRFIHALHFPPAPSPIASPSLDEENPTLAPRNHSHHIAHINHSNQQERELLIRDDRQHVSPVRRSSSSTPLTTSALSDRINQTPMGRLGLPSGDLSTSGESYSLAQLESRIVQEKELSRRASHATTSTALYGLKTWTHRIPELPNLDPDQQIKLPIDPASQGSKGMPAAPFDLGSSFAVVTYGHASLFEQVFNFIGSVHQWEPTQIIVVYDVGFSQEQVLELQCIERVFVRPADFLALTAAIDPTTTVESLRHLNHVEFEYYKPLILFDALEHSSSIVFVDPRLELRQNLRKIKEKLMMQGYFFLHEFRVSQQRDEQKRRDLGFVLGKTMAESFYQLNTSIPLSDDQSWKMVSSQLIAMVRPTPRLHQAAPQLVPASSISSATIAASPYAQVVWLAAQCALKPRCFSPPSATQESHSFASSIFSILVWKAQLNVDESVSFSRKPDDGRSLTWVETHLSHCPIQSSRAAIFEQEQAEDDSSMIETSSSDLVSPAENSTPVFMSLPSPSTSMSGIVFCYRNSRTLSPYEHSVDRNAVCRAQLNAAPESYFKISALTHHLTLGHKEKEQLWMYKSKSFGGFHSIAPSILLPAAVSAAAVHENDASASSSTSSGSTTLAATQLAASSTPLLWKLFSFISSLPLPNPNSLISRVSRFIHHQSALSSERYYECLTRNWNSNVPMLNDGCSTESRLYVFHRTLWQFYRHLFLLYETICWTLLAGLRFSVLPWIVLILVAATWKICMDRVRIQLQFDRTCVAQLLLLPLTPTGGSSPSAASMSFFQKNRSSLISIFQFTLGTIFAWMFIVQFLTWKEEVQQE